MILRCHSVVNKNKKNLMHISLYEITSNICEKLLKVEIEAKLRGSKESLKVKFKDGICSELC